MWPSTGRGVVRMSCIRTSEVKTAKISSEESKALLRNFAPAKISHYTVGILYVRNFWGLAILFHIVSS